MQTLQFASKTILDDGLLSTSRFFDIFFYQNYPVLWILLASKLVQRVKQNDNYKELHRHAVNGEIKVASTPLVSTDFVFHGHWVQRLLIEACKDKVQTADAGSNQQQINYNWVLLLELRGKVFYLPQTVNHHPQNDRARNNNAHSCSPVDNIQKYKQGA